MDEYYNHIHQLRCTVEVWAKQDGLEGEALKAYLKDNKCGGWTLSGYDTWVRCYRCSDEGHPEDYYPE